jgi:signal transduction histidine kinase
LLGVYLHTEQGHADLERRLNAAYASLEVMKRARVARIHETEERLHQARSALAAIDLAVQDMPKRDGLRDAVRSEVSVLRRLVTPTPSGVGSFRVADALVGVVTIERLYGVDVSVRVPPRLMAYGDLSGTAEVAQCLLENARIHAPGARIEVAAHRVGHEIHISVADDGPGVDLDLPVFASGVTGGSGHGLGLAIAARIMRDQGGRLWLDGDFSGGARFVLELPSAEGPHQLDDVSGVADVHRSTVSGSIDELDPIGSTVHGDGDVGV